MKQVKIQNYGYCWKKVTLEAARNEIPAQGRGQSKESIFFQEKVLNYGWVGIKSPKLFSENTHSVICTANIQ